MIVPELVSVKTSDPDAALKVVESVPGGSEKEQEFRGHAELAVLLNGDDDAKSVIASVSVAEERVVESVPGGNEDE